MRPKRYPYSKNQWEIEITVLYSGDNLLKIMLKTLSAGKKFIIVSGMKTVH